MQHEDFIKKVFTLTPSEGGSKVMSLAEAVDKYIKPGANVFLGWNTNAVSCEIIRRFIGKNPDLNLIMTMTWDHALNLIHCGLVKRLVTTSCSYLHPNPSPSHVLQRAYREGLIEIENWSLYSLQQRLMAGALGIGFMPTKSIAGSDMAADNKDSFREIDDPFYKSRKIGAVKALNPEIAFVHGLAADQYGNTILSPVSQDTLWGAKASLGGVVVTVEKIVDTDFIRRNAGLVSIPGYLVNSVSLCPLGAHPEGHFSNIDGIAGYGEDYDFMLEQRKASSDRAMLDGWLHKWVLDVKDHDGYVKSLGSDRLLSLKNKASADSWEIDLRSKLDQLSFDGQFNVVEMMVVAASRKITQKIRDSGYKVLLAGLGTCGLAAWLAFYTLRNEGYDIELVLGSGVYGYWPRPFDPMLLNIANAYTAKQLTNTCDMYGFIISGAGARCLSVIGAAQIDTGGNINTTLISPGNYIIGSGGSNDNASGASEVLVVASQSKRRCVPRVDYITSPGENIRTLVTTMGTFEKGKHNKFILTEYLPESRGESAGEAVKKLQENCGWKVEASPDLKSVDPPTMEELVILRMLDPHGHLLKD